jgi:hypothetical protein
MATMPSSVVRGAHEEAREASRTILDGSVVEAVLGILCAALAVIALFGLVPVTLAAIATIGLGAALLFEGGAIASRYEKIIADEVRSERRAAGSLGSGMAAESVGGIAGIVLGILALVGVVPMVLIPVAAIVFGMAVVFGAGATSGFNALVWQDSLDKNDRMLQVAHQAGRAASGGDVLLGFGAAVLGVLALITIAPHVLVLVALLVVSTAALINGVAVGTEARRLSTRPPI